MLDKNGRTIRPGDWVTFARQAGAKVEYYDQLGKGKVVIVGPDHVVLNCGGRYGTPAVVTAENLVRVRRGKRSDGVYL